MNAALDRFADNPIIDELVRWPPSPYRILQVRAGGALFRQPFIEIHRASGEIEQRHFRRESFAADWAEARVILETLTTIELVSDLPGKAPRDPAGLAREALAVRDACIAEAGQMFEHGLYAQFLMQFGADCRDLPAATRAQIDAARRALEQAAPGE